MHRPSRRPALLLAVAALLLGTAGATSASANEPADPLIQVLPVAAPLDPTGSAPTVEGPFDMVVQVTGGGAEDILLSPRLPSWAWFTSAPDKTIPGGTCLDSCQVTWRIDPASQATPWYSGLRHLEVSAGTPTRSLSSYGASVYYRPAVASTWAEVAADPTANTPGYATGMVDSGGMVTFSGMPGRAPGEQVNVFVLPKAGYDGASNELDGQPLASATGTWENDPETGYATGRAHLDTSALPEGSYRLVAQAHDEAGHYSYATPAALAVRHSPMHHLEVGGNGKVATGRSIGVKIYLQNPRANANAPGAVRLTVGGTTTTLAASSFDWYVPRVWEVPSERLINVPTTGLPLGSNQVGVQVLDTTGAPIGSATTSIDVVDFHEDVTIPTLIVGKAAAMLLTATAPAGTTLLQCAFTLTTEASALQNWNLCPGPNATTVAGTSTFYPDQAGPATVRAEILTIEGTIGPLHDSSVTVYANRTATLVAPWRAGHNTTQTATVTIKDEKKLGTTSAAGSGLVVTLQRKKAGTATWATIATGTTGTTGVATVKYTNAASGRLRALVKSTVPGSTVTTVERSVTSVATVSWSYLPTTARYGASVTAAVYAKPHEKGATIRLQARKLGATTWKTYGSGTVTTTSGYTKASGRLYSSGTWEVRVLRVATTTQATGYSTVRRIKVS